MSSRPRDPAAMALYPDDAMIRAERIHLIV